MRQLPLNVFLNITLTPGPWDISDPCWVWAGGKTNGYGLVRFEGKKVYVHRLVYELVKGPIPKGMVMICACDDRACCSPRHWKPFTRTEAARIYEQRAAERKELKRQAKKQRRLELSITDDDWCA